MQENFISAFKLVFWDFDGVIKDSVAVKTKAFMQLFQPYGDDVVERVRLHHHAHGGMSRFDKIPRYLALAGIMATPELVAEHCRRFADLVCQEVVDSPWVAGAEEFLRGNPFGQTYVLVTGTPREEIEYILSALDLRDCFASVYGAPMNKSDAVGETLTAYRFKPENCLMVGDALADWDAAQANQVPFLLRRHTTNGQVFKNYNGESVEDFTGLPFSGRSIDDLCTDDRAERQHRVSGEKYLSHPRQAVVRLPMMAARASRHALRCSSRPIPLKLPKLPRVLVPR